ncbi:MAG: FkbM family methyltransferase [Alphaproteobacteria bacterium]
MRNASGDSPVQGWTQGIVERLPADWRFRLARFDLAWHSRRRGHGRPISFREIEGRYEIDDGLALIRFPDFSRVSGYRRGIASSLEQAAARYGGMEQLRLPDNATVVDVGANIGEFSLWCLDRGASVVALEPDADAFACLMINLGSTRSARGLSHAAWNVRETTYFFRSDDRARGSLIERPGIAQDDVIAEAWPLDEIPEIATLPAIDLLKIDGEGAEPEILAGATRTLRSTRRVAIDVGEDHGRIHLRHRVTAILEARGFQVISGTPDGIILADNRDPAEHLARI